MNSPLFYKLTQSILTLVCLVYGAFAHAQQWVVWGDIVQEEQQIFGEVKRYRYVVKVNQVYEGQWNKPYIELHRQSSAENTLPELPQGEQALFFIDKKDDKYMVSEHYLDRQSSLVKGRLNRAFNHLYRRLLMQALSDSYPELKGTGLRIVFTVHTVDERLEAKERLVFNDINSLPEDFYIIEHYITQVLGQFSKWRFRLPQHFQLIFNENGYDIRSIKRVSNETGEKKPYL